MGIIDRKITENERDTNKVSAETRVRVQGEPDYAKTLFERLPLLITEKVNGLIDDLIKQTTLSGAEQIGCSGISGLASGANGTVKQMLERLKTEINNVAVSGLSENSINEDYLTTDAVMKSKLNGYTIANAGTPADLLTTDLVKVALGKIERHIKNLIAGVQTAGKAVGYSETGGIKDKFDTKQDILSFDSIPTQDSTMPVTSGGVKTALDAKQDTLTFDNSPKYNGTNPVSSKGIYDAISYAKSDAISQARFDQPLEEAVASEIMVAHTSNVTVYDGVLTAEMTLDWYGNYGYTPRTLFACCVSQNPHTGDWSSYQEMGITAFNFGQGNFFGYGFSEYREGTDEGAEDFFPTNIQQVSPETCYITIKLPPNGVNNGELTYPTVNHIYLRRLFR